MDYSFRLAARVLLYTPSHTQDSTYQGLCYTSHEALFYIHHSTDRISQTTAFITPVAEYWNEKWLSGSTMKDQSDDPSHHELMLYHGATSHFQKPRKPLIKVQTEVTTQVNSKALTHPSTKSRSAIGCQKKVNAWNGYIIKNWKIL